MAAGRTGDLPAFPKRDGFLCVADRAVLGSAAKAVRGIRWMIRRQVFNVFPSDPASVASLLPDLLIETSGREFGRRMDKFNL